MAMVYQHEEAPKIRGTLNAIFTIGTPISLIGLWWAGQRPNAAVRFGVPELTLGFLMMPAVVVGFLLAYIFGFERHLRGSPAGDRTFALVGASAAAITKSHASASPKPPASA